MPRIERDRQVVASSRERARDRAKEESKKKGKKVAHVPLFLQRC